MTFNPDQLEALRDVILEFVDDVCTRPEIDLAVLTARVIVRIEEAVSDNAGKGDARLN